jgi:hypothetical protein
MAYADYEHCPGCDGRVIYKGDTAVPDDVVCWHLACLEIESQASAAAISNQATAAERARLAAVISPEQFRKLAAWFDEDDQVKMWLYSDRPDIFPSTWEERGTAIQDDLRKFADLLDGTQ